MRYGGAGDPDDVTSDSDRGWNTDDFDSPPKPPDSYDRADSTGTDPESFYEGHPDDWDLDSVGVFVLNLGDHPEHLELTEELRRRFSIIIPSDEPDDDE